MTEPETPPYIYTTNRSRHLEYILDLWHSIGQLHAELTRDMMLGSVDPPKFADLVARVLELWKELSPYDDHIINLKDRFVSPTKVLDDDITWVNEAILELSFSLKRLGITEFREV